MKRSVAGKVSFILAVMLLCTIFAGCNGSKGKVGTAQVEKQDSSTAVVFPLQKPVKLRYWTAVQVKPDNVANEEMKKRTGIDVEFILPPAGQPGSDKQQLNLMIASGDLPDIIELSTSYYPGMSQKAFDDGVAIDLTDLQKKYAPNITKLYKEYPQLLADIENDEGKRLFFPFLKDAKALTYYGPLVRKDWMDDLGIKDPLTIGEFYDMLKAFKDKKGAKAAFTGTAEDVLSPILIGAFGISKDYFAEKGKVLYGPADPRYKEYVSTMAKWYKDGVLDSEFAVNNAAMIDAKMTNGQSGAIYGLQSGHIGKYLDLMKKKDPKYDLKGVPYPSVKQGEANVFMQKDTIVFGHVIISRTCKSANEAVAYLDYGYSKEGNTLFNFGVEGVSYTNVNGRPKFTEAIMKNPDKLSPKEALQKYTRSFGMGPYSKSSEISDQFAVYPQQVSVGEVWTKYSKETAAANTRVYGNLTSEENSSISSKMVEIDTYQKEMLLKWVMGTASLDNFDDYLKQLDKMGLKDVLKVKQTAYDRFIKNHPDALKPADINLSEYFKK